ncbi:tRNA guanosine(34) transglycosylase Tgt [Phaeocystidibacter luteus]|uniref:Queuine tRNA-ribosyltransferase n=1 Tax=Phaeocystidibacter luteus TaxID=911197 RepID=A0A6N6RCX3_9FLAO|nr:tRNA guanosine(34) transglycosylase Tgt [Phaeocystidibacter luteus]KAB2806766.1 tRNA guanosine(34) transglycosylase Tgt [Phaeocystidibacter luteus]
MKFELQATDKQSKARAGKLTTAHGEIETPIFMPVGTVASVKAVHQPELVNDVKAEIILGNTYHLYLRPGTETLQAAGGLHKFMNWERPILTDSGGFQVYSLDDISKITEQGVKFKSHIDGSTHLFTPENVMDVQRQIGADIIMAFDECTPYPCDVQYAKEAMDRTHRWLDRCIRRFDETDPLYGYDQTLFPIVQGSVYPELRKQSAEYIAQTDREGYAIGGLSVGEPHEDMYEMSELVCDILPKDKPRYLMGVGTPANILENIALGVDMFDCVMPARNGRNGQIFTSEGIMNIKNAKWAKDFSPLDPNGDSFVDSIYSKAYVRHLFQANEYLGRQIASLHNLRFYLWLVKQARQKIQEGTFAEWKNVMVPKLQNRL